MNQSSAYPFDHHHEVALDLSLSKIDKVADEVLRGRAELVDSQKKNVDCLKSGGKSGITMEFGKVVLVSEPDAAGLVIRLEQSRRIAEAEPGHGVERGDRVLEPACSEFELILAKVMDTPELKSLLENPLPTMLWTPATHRLIPDRLAPLSSELRLPAHDHERSGHRHPGEHSASARPDDGEIMRRNLESRPEQRDHGLEVRRALTVGNDSAAGASTVERLAATVAPKENGQPPEESIGDNSNDKPKWEKRPELSHNLERPARDEEISREDLGEDRRSWAQLPKLRRTLEHPGKMEEIARDQQTRFVVNLANAFQLYRENDELAGDAALGRAISELVRPCPISDSGISIQLLRVATIGGLLAEYSQHAAGGPCDSVGQVDITHSQTTELGRESRYQAMSLDRTAEMNMLAERAVGSSMRLVAEAQGDQITPEAISSLTLGLVQAMRAAIAEQAAGVAQTTIESLAQATAKEERAELLAKQIKQHLSEAIEHESRQTLQTTISAMALSVAQDNSAQGNPLPGKGALSSECLSGEKAGHRNGGRNSELQFMGGSGFLGRCTEPPQANKAADGTVKKWDKRRSVKSEEVSRNASPGVLRETKKRSIKKTADRRRPELTGNRASRLESGGAVVPEQMSPSESRDPGRALTITIMSRAAEGVSRLGELLVGALTNSGSLVRLISGCSALTSRESRPSATNIFNITLDTIGAGETVLVVLASDQNEARELQAHIARLMEDRPGAVPSGGQSVRANSHEQASPILPLVTPHTPLAVAENHDALPEDNRSLRSLVASRSGVAGSPASGLKSVWDTVAAGCKQVLYSLMSSSSQR